MKGTKRSRRILGQLALLAGRLSILAFVVFVVLYGLHRARNSSGEEALFQLRGIDYEGLVHLQAPTLDLLIRRTFPSNLLAVDLQRVRELVESEAWVQQASVRRKLPDRLVISIVERTPEAVATIDDELYVVDRDGVILDRFGPSYEFLDRPIVKGLKNLARENARQENVARMRLYLKVLAELQQHSQDFSRTLSEIHVDGAGRVAVVPSDEPVRIYLGDGEFLARYQLFLSQKALYHQLKEKYGQIDYVDVTYDNKIIFHTPQETPRSPAPPFPEQSG